MAAWACRVARSTPLVTAYSSGLRRGAAPAGRTRGMTSTPTPAPKPAPTPASAPPAPKAAHAPEHGHGHGHAHAHGHGHGHAHAEHVSPVPPVPWHRRAFAAVAQPFVHVSGRYMHYLHTYPVATKSVTSGFMYCFGDLLAQAVAPSEHDAAAQRARLDTQRAAIFFVYGLTVAGPIYHFWFSRLDRLPFLMMKTRRFQQMVRFRRLQRSARELGVTLPAGAKPKKPAEFSKVAKVTSKVLADQIIFSPLYLLVFFYTTGVMRGQTVDECTEHIKQVFWPSFLADCAVWPAVQVINFAFVPVPLQPIYVNVLNVFWNAFLSFMAHKTH